MPKQKLPTGWAYDEFDHAYNDNIDDDLSTVQAVEGRVSIGEDDSSSAPASVVLAVIRNAGLDPVYELAKRMFNNDKDNSISTVAAWELQRLIASLKEP